MKFNFAAWCARWYLHVLHGFNQNDFKCCTQLQRKQSCCEVVRASAAFAVLFQTICQRSQRGNFVIPASMIEMLRFTCWRASGRLWISCVNERRRVLRTKWWNSQIIYISFNGRKASSIDEALKINGIHWTWSMKFCLFECSFSIFSQFSTQLLANDEI